MKGHCDNYNLKQYRRCNNIVSHEQNLLSVGLQCVATLESTLTLEFCVSFGSVTITTWS